MISLPFVKFCEHISVQLHIWEIECMSVWEDEDDLLITHIMPVGRIRMKFRGLHWQNNNAENNYVKYSYFESYSCYQPMNFPFLPPNEWNVGTLEFLIGELINIFTQSFSHV